MLSIWVLVNSSMSFAPDTRKRQGIGGRLGPKGARAANMEPVPSLSELSWSDDVAQAAWITEALTSTTGNVATHFVPSGFEAYARLLHPVVEADERLVRWREIAAWSGLPLHPYARFHSVALPPEPVEAPPPWSGSGPHGGDLFVSDATTLIGRLRRSTVTPDRCWFCLWEGFGWYDDVIPRAVKTGPRVRLPYRDCYLYRGPLESALVGNPGEAPDHSACLWWPDDHAWCVASDVDLSWTYVGGSHALVEALVCDPTLEVLEVEPHVPVTRLGSEPWIERWVSDAVEALSREEDAVISTPAGTVVAWLEPHHLPGRAWLRTHHLSASGQRGSGGSNINVSDKAKMRDQLDFYVRWAVVGLVGD